MDNRIIAKKLELLQKLEIAQTLALEPWLCRTALYRAPGDYAFEGDWNPAELPARFAPRKTVFLKSRIEVPAKDDMANWFLAFDFRDMEGSLRIDGRLYCGIDVNHMRIPVPRSGAMELTLEFNSEPKALFEPERDRYGFGEFRSGALVQLDRHVEALRCDLSFVYQTTLVIGDERRKKRLQAALEEALLAVDLNLPRPELSCAAASALNLFRKRLAEIAPDPESGTLCAIGHTHIDTAWLWPLKETVRKCGRTFSTASRFMEIYPDYHFSCSQAQLYDYVRRTEPELFEEIRRHVKGGRWENTGAMWVEPDCNVPNGESLIRQVLYGLKFYREEFGTRPVLCWLPDVFGYPASLPEILVSCGLRYFSTNKLHWQAKEPFPYHLFHWRGLDGSEILAHIAKLPNFYNGFVIPEMLHQAWQDFEQKDRYDEMLYSFGYGDGGGGVTEEMMLMIQRAKSHVPGMPGLRMDTAEGFFRRVEEKAPELPVYDGELYLQTHRGTYTTHGEVKRANRQNETLLRDAEILGVMASIASGKPVRADLDEAWKTLLLNQFHDILPGSSITEIYPRSLADHAKVAETARRAIAEAMQACSAGAGAGRILRVFNTLSWERCDAIEAEIPAFEGDYEAVDFCGKTYPVQRLCEKDGLVRILFTGAAVPAMGCADFTLRPAAKAAASSLQVSASLLENDELRVELDERGCVTRIYDKRFQREVLTPGSIGGELQLFQDGPEDEDAWNVHELKQSYAFDPVVQVEVAENGPVRGAVRVVRTRAGRSRFVQEIRLTDHARQLEFAMDVDWHERNTILKIAFPVEIRSTRTTCEVQFGACERATHRNTVLDQQKFEIPMQRWFDLSEGGYGVSVLNDCRYGGDVLGSVMRLSLLRGTIHPDPVADVGRHLCSCAIAPHGGDWACGGTVRQAWEYNTPHHCGFTDRAEEPRSLIQLTGYEGAVLQTVKPAEDGRGIILRVYEAEGGRGPVQCLTDFPCGKVTRCNSVEEDEEVISSAAEGFRFALTPYRIATFRIEE